jgi:hypothetical protein
MMVAMTTTASNEKRIVNPLAMLNAAPGFLTSVKRRKSPMTGCGLAENEVSAQLFVA